MMNFEDLLARVGIEPGQTIGDLGCGREGHLALLLAKRVGETGRVYALDIIKSILPALENKAKSRGVHNIITVWSDLEVYDAAKAIPNNTLDAGFVVTVLWQSKHPEAILKECIRMIKPGGKLVVIDWNQKQGPFGPLPELRVPREKVENWGKNLGLKQVESYGASPSHYGVIFLK